MFSGSGGNFVFITVSHTVQPLSRRRYTEGSFLMAGGKKMTLKKPTQRSKRKVRKQNKHRGPVIRFKFSRLVLLWIFSLILCFGAYLYKINFHPDPKKTPATNSSSVAELPPDSGNAEESVTDESSVVSDSLIDVPNGETSEEDTPSVPSGPKKTNPVPESAAPQTAEYLETCAFLGETNIYNLGLAGLLKPYSVYASDRLSLLNYKKEYVMLNDSTIRILSAINSASCPIYLMFGTETLASHPADESAEQFRILLDDCLAAAPESEIYVLSVPPVAASAEKGDKPLLNSTIDDYNSKLLEICNEKNVYFVDTNTALKDNNGKLDPHYAIEDGIHLTTEAGQILLNYILTHVPA